MPEGHVLHRLANGFNAHFAGQQVEVTSPQGRFADAAALLNNTQLVGAEAIGKHLLIDFAAEQTVWIHLGLIGKFRVVDRAELVSPDTLRLRIAYGDKAAELRGPQWCRLITAAERAEVLASSGPDPLRADADPGIVHKKLAKTKRSIAQTLMDQKIFAGVGNIFRCEVLFRHGIDPMLPACELSDEMIDSIWDDLVFLMNEAVRLGQIDTVFAAHTPEAMGRPPRVDAHGGEVYVYRRSQLPCLVCGTEVQTTMHTGRSLFWCPRCQPAGSRGEIVAEHSN